MGSSVAAAKAEAAGLQATVAICGNEGDSVASRVMKRLAEEAETPPVFLSFSRVNRREIFDAHVGSKSRFSSSYEADHIGS